MTDPVTTPDAGWRTRLARLARELFYVDLRSLALLRICLGLLIVADLVTRARHFTAHYTDLGVAPREVLFEHFGRSCHYSLHWWLSGIPLAEACLFVAAGLCAIGLLLGWRTRMMTVLCWYFQASLLIRMPLLHTAGDETLQLLLLWSLLLPMGARWSLDAVRRPELASRSNTHVSVAGFALLMQVCLIYWVAVVLKLHIPMWWEGDALAFALTREGYVTGIGGWIGQFEDLLPLMALATLAWELLGPLVPFIPRFTTPGRIIAIIGFWLLHLGFGLALNLGIFPWISSAAWVVFIPTGFWDRVLARSRVDDGAEPMRAHWLATIMAAGAFMMVLAMNIRSIPRVGEIVPSVIARAGNAMRLRQGWGMFTARGATPGRSGNGRFIVVGALDDGGEIDLLAPSATPSWELEEIGSRPTVTARWTQFLYYDQDIKESPYWSSYGAYLCRAWNNRLDGELVRVSVWFLDRPQPFGDDRARLIRLYEGTCETGEPSS